MTIFCIMKNNKKSTIKTVLRSPAHAHVSVKLQKSTVALDGSSVQPAAFMCHL